MAMLVLYSFDMDKYRTVLSYPKVDVSHILIDERPDVVVAVAWLHQKGRTMIAGCTRENGTIGLPGGKVEDGENPFDAVIRESREEGWKLNIYGERESAILKKEKVDGFLIWWIRCHIDTRVPQDTEWKEKHRGIYPVIVPPSALAFESNKFLHV